MSADLTQAEGPARTQPGMTFCQICGSAQPQVMGASWRKPEWGCARGAQSGGGALREFVPARARRRGIWRV